MSLFSSIRTYNGAWSLKGSEKLADEDIKEIASAKVVDSQFGKSVCFTLVNGQSKYMGLSRDCELETGDEIDVKSVEIITLSRAGDSDTHKVKGLKK
jgi:hypothetical protein